MADSYVGGTITRWLIGNFKSDISAIVAIEENEITEISRSKSIPTLLYKNGEELITNLSKLGSFDFGILAWWPKIISPELISLPKKGFINTHPSLLPYNRGKHYNFWALVEQSPYGVSLHFLGNGIDDGDIIAQTPIKYSWEDNGETMYNKANISMIKLFKKTYPSIRLENIKRRTQNLSKGSFHLAKELDEKSKIKLDSNYKARELLNLLRARTFTGQPACYFTDNGKTYEVTINIKRKSNE